MSKYAQGKWRYLVARLAESKIINEIDGDTLWRYVEALDDFRELVLAKRRHRREMEKLPAADRWHDSKLLSDTGKADARCNQLGMKFGLSPCDRTKIQTQRAPEETPAAKPTSDRPRLQMLDPGPLAKKC
jgi:P27 family predicted phage terminase small subunit